VTVKEIVSLVNDLDRLNLYVEIGVLTQNAALAFGVSEISHADPQGNNSPDLVLVNSKIVPEKMRAEMPPSVGEKHVELRRHDALGIKFLIYQVKVGVEQHKETGGDTLVSRVPIITVLRVGPKIFWPFGGKLDPADAFYLLDTIFGWGG